MLHWFTLDEWVLIKIKPNKDICNVLHVMCTSYVHPFTQIQSNLQLRNLEVACLHLLSSFLQNIDQEIDFVCIK